MASQPARTQPDSSAAMGGRSSTRAGSSGAGAASTKPASPTAGLAAPASTGAGAGGRPEAGQGGAAGQGEAGGPAAGAGFQCPAGPFGAPFASGAKAERVAGLPPTDTFNDMGRTRTNLEGPVWIGDKLYVSEFAFMPAPDARILALDPASGEVTVALASTGSNGLAVDMSGALIATDHKQGAVVRMPFPLGMAAETLTGMFEGKRFNSPNDLALRSDGTLYFSDPDYQAPSMKPQDKTRVYHLAVGTDTPDMFDDTRSQPNGVTLSADDKTLYVAGADGVFSYPIAADGKVAPGSGTRVNAFNGGADGLGMDCAGNLYITSGQRVVVLSAAGMELGSIDVSQAESVTNVAFGGPDRKTLFITSMGSGEQRGVFRVQLDVPGFPY
jgi:gluconolactonase